jgi:hypothetical protein
VRLREVPLPVTQLLVGRDQVLERGDEQVQQLLPLGRDREAASEEEQLQTHARAGLQPHLAGVEDAAQPRDELVHVVGLAEEVVGAGGQSVDDVERVRQRGQQDDRKVGIGVLDLPAQLVAVHAGHDDVRQHQVHRTVGKPLQGPPPVLGLNDVKPCAVQAGTQALGLRAAVLDHEHCRHRPPLLGSRAAAPDSERRRATPRGACCCSRATSSANAVASAAEWCI